MTKKTREAEGVSNKINELKPTCCIRIKFAVTGSWGTSDELQFRHLCEERIDHALKQADAGFCDGGGFGAGEMEIFNYVHDESIGSRIIKSVLIDMGLIYPTITCHPDIFDDDEQWHTISDGHTALNQEGGK